MTVNNNLPAENKEKPKRRVLYNFVPFVVSLGFY